MKQIDICLNETYPIYIDEGILTTSLLADFCQSLQTRLIMITDSHVEPIIGKSLQAHLLAQGVAVELMVIPAGEQHKTRETKARLENNLLAKQYGRDTCLIALGGGVVSDLVGFLASTYCRGIKVIYVPTTLLAMVDASIGGKTGVNTPHGKNLIGSIYQPQAVFIDTSVLKTLPEKEYRNGVVEIIKHSMIADADLFQALQHRNKSLLELIYNSCLIKKTLVEQDENDNGIRQLLNFGHTIAHAIEILERYQLTHGEAVAIGMIIEAHLSMHLGVLNMGAYQALCDILRAYHLPLKTRAFRDKQALLRQICLDKKNIANQPRFVMLEDIGRVYIAKNAYTSTVPEDILHDTLEWAAGEFSR